jgi:thimet oligopeptidase
MTTDLLRMPSEPGKWAEWLEERSGTCLRDAADQIVALKLAASGDVAVLQRWNDASISISNAAALASLMSSVHPESKLVELAEQLEVEIQRFHNDLLLDREVFDQLSAIDQGHLDPPALRVRSLAVRSFRRAGVDLDEPTREEIRELNDRETVLSQAFSRNIRDGRRTALVPAAALAGFPADFVESHPADADGLVAITTEHPDVHAFLTYCRDPDARRALALEFFNLAWPQNDAVLGDLLRLRRDKAQLLGYSDWPDFDAEVKMIGNGQAIGEFIDSVAADSLAAGQRDLAILAKRGAEDGIEVIDLSSWRYCFEAVKREQYGVDAQEVRRYFAFPKVHQGLLEVTGRLFGLRYEPVQVATWHADVTSYDVYLAGADGTENLLGRIHLDLHPREHKYNHAAQFTLVPGVRGRQLPEAVLVCNFSRGLMDHSEVVTLFHEFGHLMHHMLAGRHEWVRFSGVATEWDFVEAPSQMLEEWARDAGVLQMFATDDAGVAIPTELVARGRGVLSSLDRPDPDVLRRDLVPFPR